MNGIEIPELRTAFTFRRRAMALPSDLRPTWRVGMVLLWLRKCCRQNRSSLWRLHVLNWGTLTKENRLALQRCLGEPGGTSQFMVRIEPALNLAVSLAAAEGLVHRPDGQHVQLTRKGIELADSIATDDRVYRVEKELVASLRTRVSEKLVAQLFEGR